MDERNACLSVQSLPFYFTYLRWRQKLLGVSLASSSWHYIYKSERRFYRLWRRYPDWFWVYLYNNKSPFYYIFRNYKEKRLSWSYENQSLTDPNKDEMFQDAWMNIFFARSDTFFDLRGQNIKNNNNNDNDNNKEDDDCCWHWKKK